jgi:hypothetical protein
MSESDQLSEADGYIYLDGAASQVPSGALMTKYFGILHLKQLYFFS